MEGEEATDSQSSSVQLIAWGLSNSLIFETLRAAWPSSAAAPLSFLMRTNTLLLVAVLALLVPAALSVDLDLSIDQTSGAFKVIVDGTTWLASGDVGLYSNGWISTAPNDTTLNMISRQDGYSDDRLGVYHYTNFIWLTPSRTPMVTSIKQYRDFPAIAFEQSFPQGVSSTTYDVPTFPSFPLRILLFETHSM